MTTVEDALAGTRITFRNSSISSFILASQGVMLTAPHEAARLKDIFDKRVARFKQIVEAPASQ